jgi:uncharacterized DUF497 family protein
MPTGIRVTGFEWDTGNLDKSYKKHGITPSEAEEIFLDENALEIEDVKHSDKEIRHVAIGKTSEKKILFVVFTVRKAKVRIISARRANRKEKTVYEQNI